MPLPFYKKLLKSKPFRWLKWLLIYYLIILVFGFIGIAGFIYVKRDEIEKEIKTKLSRISTVPLLINICFSKNKPLKKLPEGSKKIAVFIHKGKVIEVYQKGENFFAIYNSTVYLSKNPFACKVYFKSSP